MTWFAFKGYNVSHGVAQAIDIAGTQEKEAVIFGFHGYATQAIAQANPNSVASFPNPLAVVQIPFVNLIIADYHEAVKQQSQPGGTNATITNPATAVKAGVTGLVHDIPGVGSIDDLINAFKNNFENVLLRVGEIIVGVILLYVGVKAMATPSGQSVQNTSIARKAVKYVK